MSSGSLLRGHLRPSSARGPPFLVIGLVLVVVILGFNYWNLNGEYHAIGKEIADLQDNLQMAVLKKEKAERQCEMYEKRIRETEGQLGKEKRASEQRDRQLAKVSEQLDAKADEMQKLQEQLGFCQQSNVDKLETSSKQLEDLQGKYKVVEEEKEQLTRDNEKLLTAVRDLKLKLEELTFQQARLGMAHVESNPALIRAMPSNGTATEDFVKNSLPEDHVNVLPQANNTQPQFLANDANQTAVQQQEDQREINVAENPGVEDNQDNVPGGKPEETVDNALPGDGNANRPPVDDKDKPLQNEEINVSEVTNPSAKDDEAKPGQSLVAPVQVIETAGVGNDNAQQNALDRPQETRNDNMSQVQANAVEIEQPVQIEHFANNLDPAEKRVLFEPHENTSDASQPIRSPDLNPAPAVNAIDENRVPSER